MSINRGFEISSNENPKGGNDYLFIIGIDRYKYIKPLNNAVKDAQSIQEILIKKYQFSRKCTYQLYDNKATRHNIISRFDELVEELTEEDTLLIFYAGHGYYKNEIGYWVPVGGKTGKHATFINHSTIRDYMKAIKAHHILLIVDSCFSGNLLRSPERSNNPPTVYADEIARFPSRWCIAAGMIEKVSDGIIGEHSPFAKSLITFLKINRKARFHVLYLFNHVSEATSSNARQTPIGGVIKNTGDQNGQYIFMLKEKSHDYQRPFARLKYTNREEEIDLAPTIKDSFKGLKEQIIELLQTKFIEYRGKILVLLKTKIFPYKRFIGLTLIALFLGIWIWPGQKKVTMFGRLAGCSEGSKVWVKNAKTNKTISTTKVDSLGNFSFKISEPTPDYIQIYYGKDNETCTDSLKKYVESNDTLSILAKNVIDCCH